MNIRNSVAGMCCVLALAATAAANEGLIELSDAAEVVDCGCSDAGFCDACAPPRRAEFLAEYILFDIWADGVGGGSFGAESGFRGSLKYNVGHDFGLRLRGFWLDSSTTTFGVNVQAKFANYDIDFTYDDQFCNWDITTHGGIRLGQVEWTRTAGTPALISTSDLEGVGVTLGAEATRCLFGPLSVVFSGRYSTVQGTHRTIRNAPVGTPSVGTAETFIDMVEFAYGLEYDYDMGCTGRAFARLWWEHQIYNLGDFRQAGANVDKINIGGAVFAIGFER